MVLIRFASIIQLIGLLYGLYNAFVSDQFISDVLPKGMGFALSIICFTMFVVLINVKNVVETIREHVNQSKAFYEFLENISVSLATHERDFYRHWYSQVQEAKNNIDVTHLGLRPPTLIKDTSEQKYFADLKKLYNNSPAKIRRVERYSPEKIDWIKSLVSNLQETKNFSLGLYQEPTLNEMPLAISVSRIDEKYGWIVAMAEQSSTTNIRDVMLTGKESTNLLAKYFQERLWGKSIIIIQDGKLVRPNWEGELTNA